MPRKTSKPNPQLLIRRPISEVKLRDAESRSFPLLGDLGMGAFGVIAALASARRRGVKPWQLG